jgi:spermidine/putrescine transport system ATP-binding protein
MSERAMIELRGLTKRYGDALAADSVTLDIGRGEFFSLLGPSGCGKTTTLRMIAGFEEPTSGSVTLDGEDVTWVSPRRRKVNMVFQDYALFPHMTVAENVAFGPKLSKVSKGELREKVARILASVRLEGYENRRPAQLSGGQRQRVALARALVNEPAALLLDEPLGALDLKLRKEMQLELKAIQQRTGTTFVYVTHDQEEALTMSDRIAVMNGGKVEQVDTARAVYDRPATEFVADFIGTSNLLSLRVDRREAGTVAMELGGGMSIVAPDPGGAAHETVSITVRPEKVCLGTEPGPGWSCLRGRVAQNVFLGSVTQLVIELQTGETLTVHELNDDEEAARLAPGSEVTVGWAIGNSYPVGQSPTTSPDPAEVVA